MPLTTISFAELSVDDILSLSPSDSWVRVGTRRTKYFGSIPYSYGKTKHPACEYPASPVLTHISEQLASLFPNFSLEEYSCLLTHYPDGKASIPLHSDDESQILSGSKILTISIGAARELTLQNQSGVVKEANIPLPHGSLHIMPRDLQPLYKHGIRPSKTVTAPRVSITFRKLTPPQQLPPRERPPPIQHPDQYRAPTAPPIGTHDRVLLLTDSILSATPTFIFERVSSSPTVLIKKTCYKLVDVAGYEPEFGYTKTVILSSGVNDISRHGLRATVLADLFCKRLGEWCRKYPNTNFVFNSLLHTKLSWLNAEIDNFNQIMFDFCKDYHNLNFFDSHEILMADKLSEKVENVLVPGPGGNGIHITKQARVLVNDGMVDAVCWLHTSSDSTLPSRLRRYRWPLRRSFGRPEPVRARFHP